MKNESFMDTLQSNDETSMKQFLLSNGKVKPHSPVYFTSNPKGEYTHGRRKNHNESTDEGDQGSNSEAEVCEQS
jgi:hypothetical protein